MADQREAVAAMAFTYAGKQYEIGAPFPHRALGLSAFELGGMIRAGRVRLAAATAPPVDLELDKLTPAQLADLEAATAPAPPPKRVRR